MRIVLIIPNTLSIIYDYIVDAHANSLLNVIEVTVIIISLFKFIYIAYKEKQEKNNNSIKTINTEQNLINNKLEQPQTSQTLQE